MKPRRFHACTACRGGTSAGCSECATTGTREAQDIIKAIKALTHTALSHELIDGSGPHDQAWHETFRDLRNGIERTEAKLEAFMRVMRNILED